MLALRVVPCLDVRAGRVVKGVRFEGLRDMGDPVELALAYEGQGADELVVLDISASLESRGPDTETVARLRAALSIPVTVGGGVTDVDAARRLLEAGADKVAVNSAALARPQLVADLARAFGGQCTVVSIDAFRTGSGYRVAGRSATERTERSVLDWARDVEQLGAGEILATSIDRDGTRSGYDLELLRALSDTVSLPIIASGGVDGYPDLIAGARAGASAVLAASMFHEGEGTVDGAKLALAAAGIVVRSSRASGVTP